MATLFFFQKTAYKTKM